MNDVLASLSTSNQAKAAPGDPGAVLCKTTCAGLSLHGALSGDFAAVSYTHLTLPTKRIV